MILEPVHMKRRLMKNPQNNQNHARVETTHEQALSEKTLRALVLSVLRSQSDSVNEYEGGFRWQCQVIPTTGSTALNWCTLASACASFASARECWATTQSSVLRVLRGAI